jgi:hypothetical protein
VRSATAIRGAVAPLLETIDHLNEQIRSYEQMEAHIARERYPKYELLKQVETLAEAYRIAAGD